MHFSHPRTKQIEGSFFILLFRSYSREGKCESQTEMNASEDQCSTAKVVIYEELLETNQERSLLKDLNRPIDH